MSKIMLMILIDVGLIPIHVKISITSWYTRRCRVNKVKKKYVVLVARRHPLLPVTSRCHMV